MPPIRTEGLEPWSREAIRAAREPYLQFQREQRKAAANLPPEAAVGYHLQVRLWLRSSDTQISRLLRVPATTTFMTLHRIILAAFDWPEVPYRHFEFRLYDEGNQEQIAPTEVIVKHQEDGDTESCKRLRTAGNRTLAHIFGPNTKDWKKSRALIMHEYHSVSDHNKAEHQINFLGTDEAFSQTMPNWQERNPLAGAGQEVTCTAAEGHPNQHEHGKLSLFSMNSDPEDLDEDLRLLNFQRYHAPMTDALTISRALSRYRPHRWAPKTRGTHSAPRLPLVNKTLSVDAKRLLEAFETGNTELSACMTIEECSAGSWTLCSRCHNGLRNPDAVDWGRDRAKGLAREARSYSRRVAEGLEPAGTNFWTSNRQSEDRAGEDATTDGAQGPADDERPPLERGMADYMRNMPIGRLGRRT